MGFWNTLFGGAEAPAADVDPSDPTYVPTPKAKVPGAMHPGVRAKLENPTKPRPRGVGIVYDAAGKPKITRDWIDNLSPGDRAAADANLAAHGWKLGADNTIMRI